MLLIGVQNTGAQTVLTDGTINTGSVYRKFCRKNKCGVPAFSTTANSVSLQQQGIYHVTATFVGSGTAAGDVTIQMYENGTPVTGAITTHTITTADTEIRTFVIDYYVLVGTTELFGVDSTVAKTITFQNTGVGATFSNVVVNVTKEV